MKINNLQLIFASQSFGSYVPSKLLAFSTHKTVHFVHCSLGSSWWAASCISRRKTLRKHISCEQTRTGITPRLIANAGCCTLLLVAVSLDPSLAIRDVNVFRELFPHSSRASLDAALNKQQLQSYLPAAQNTVELRRVRRQPPSSSVHKGSARRKERKAKMQSFRNCF